ncbi:CHAP domain-containing protein, partial [Thioclava sp. BHET1]
SYHPAPVQRAAATAEMAPATVSRVSMVMPRPRPELIPAAPAPASVAAPVAAPAASGPLSIPRKFYRWCVPFARDVSKIDIQGDAWRWWHRAKGVYARGHQPVRGAVLNFRATHEMPLGHVAVVSRVISKREILVDQANWIPRTVTKGTPVIDVSAKNDWSVVRVANRYDTFGSVYPTYGFIYNQAPGEVAKVVEAKAEVTTTGRAKKTVSFARQMH